MSAPLPREPSVVERVRRRLSADAAEPTALTVADALRAEQQVVGSSTVLRVVDQLRSETRGAGVLERLAANLGTEWPTDRSLLLHFIDPFPAGPGRDRKSTRLNSSHCPPSRMPSSA